MTDEKEPSRFLLTQKITYLGTVANVSMTWWVSSVVFCGSILAGVWINRGELVESGVIKWFGLFLFIFFLSIVIFGILVIAYLRKLRGEVSKLAAELNDENYFSTEIKAFTRAMLVGTFSFILILIGWVFLWKGLSSGLWKVKPPEAQPNNSLNPTPR